MNDKTDSLLKLPYNYFHFSDSVCVMYFIGRECDYSAYMSGECIHDGIKNGKTTLNLTDNIKDIDKYIESKRQYNTYSTSRQCVFDLIFLPDKTKMKVDDEFRENIYCEVIKQIHRNDLNKYTAKQYSTDTRTEINGGTEFIFNTVKEAVDRSKEILYNALYGTPMSEFTSHLINDKIRESINRIITIFFSEKFDEISDGMQKAEKRVKKNVKFKKREFYEDIFIFKNISKKEEKKVLYITTSDEECVELMNVHRDKEYTICLTSYVKYRNILTLFEKRKNALYKDDNGLYDMNDSKCKLLYMTDEFIHKIGDYKYVLFQIPSTGQMTKFFLKMMEFNIKHKAKIFMSDRIVMEIKTKKSVDYSKERQYFKGNIVRVVHENFNPELGNSAGKGFILMDIDREHTYKNIEYSMFGVEKTVKNFSDCRLYGNRDSVMSILEKVHSKFELCSNYHVAEREECHYEHILNSLGGVFFIVYNDNVQMPLGHENSSPDKWFYGNSYYDRGFFNGIMNSNEKWVDRIMNSKTFNLDELTYSENRKHNLTIIYSKNREELENLSYNLHNTKLGRFIAMVSTYDNQSSIREIYPYMVDKKYIDSDNDIDNELYVKCDLSISEMRLVNDWNKLMFGKNAFYLRYKTGDKNIDVSEPYKDVLGEIYLTENKCALF